MNATSTAALTILVSLATTGDVAQAKENLGKSFSAHIVALKRQGLVEKVGDAWTLTRAAVSFAVEQKFGWAAEGAVRIGAQDLLPAPVAATPAPKKARTAKPTAAASTGERANPWPLEHEPPALDQWAGGEVKEWNGYTIYPVGAGYSAQTPDGQELLPAAKGATCFKRQQAARWAVWADHARVQTAIAASKTAAA